MPIITPTTKEEKHDRPISPNEIIKDGWMTKKQWEYCSKKALELFSFGQKKAADKGLVLVDTKYEMGISNEGNITLIDEIHTPDSSRYWIKNTLNERITLNKEPVNIDKEFLDYGSKIIVIHTTMINYQMHLKISSLNCLLVIFYSTK